MIEMFEENDDVQNIYHNWENEDEYEEDWLLKTKNNGLQVIMQSVLFIDRNDIFMYNNVGKEICQINGRRLNLTSTLDFARDKRRWYYGLPYSTNGFCCCIYRLHNYTKKEVIAQNFQ